MSDLAPAHGKGEALWKGLAASTGDLVAAIDADLRDVEPGFVTGLLGPLLDDPGVAFVKGFYHRPLLGDGTVDVDGGGRVSELVARPLLNLAWPQLAGFVQPLAGEFAARRELLEAIPFVTGYGVELGMLVDVLDRVGLDGLAQVDLGVRVHRHHDLQALGRMSAQIQLAASARLARQGILTRLPRRRRSCSSDVPRRRDRPASTARWSRPTSPSRSDRRCARSAPTTGRWPDGRASPDGPRRRGPVAAGAAGGLRGDRGRAGHPHPGTEAPRGPGGTRDGGDQPHRGRRPGDHVRRAPLRGDRGALQPGHGRRRRPRRPREARAAGPRRHRPRALAPRGLGPHLLRRRRPAGPAHPALGPR